MNIGVMTVTISLPGCASRKEKRQRVGGLHERFGRNPAIAVCESGRRDRLESSEWTFVVAALTTQEVDTLCGEIEDKLQRTVDGRLLDISREFL